MKKIQYLIAALSVFALAFSCTEKDTYVKGEPDLKDTKGIFFQDLAQTFYEFAPEQDAFIIPVALERPSAEGAVQDVPVQVSNPLFVLSPVSFEDGQLVANATLTLSKEAPAGEKHVVEVSITDPKFISIYGLKPTSVTVTAQIVKWNVISTKATYSDRIFVYLIGANPVSTTITVEERDDMPGLLRMKSPYTAEYGARLVAGTANDGLGALLTAKEDLYINATNPQKVWIADYSFETLGWAMMTYSPEVGFSKGTGYGIWDKGVLTLRAGSLIAFAQGSYYIANGGVDWVLIDCHLK